MREKTWYEVKVTCNQNGRNSALSRPMIDETVAKVKSSGLAYQVKLKMEEIYKSVDKDAVVRVV